jgi:hypothetical protein
MKLSHDLPPRSSEGSDDDRPWLADAPSDALLEAQDDGPASGDTTGSVPPLRIAHILLFTACTAGYLMLLRDRLRLGGWLQSSPDATVAFLAAEATCVGPALGALYLWRRWHARGIRFPLYGGEWLLLIFGGLALVDALARVMLTRLDRGYTVGVFSALILLAGLLTLVALMLWLATSQHRLPERWRVFFVVKVLALALAVFDPPRGVAIFLAFLEFLTLSIVAVLDLRAPRRFPWTHWLGVAVCLGNGAILLTQELWWASVFHRALGGS